MLLFSMGGFFLALTYILNSFLVENEASPMPELINRHFALDAGAMCASSSKTHDSFENVLYLYACTNALFQSRSLASIDTILLNGGLFIKSSLNSPCFLSVKNRRLILCNSLAIIFACCNVQPHAIAKVS